MPTWADEARRGRRRTRRTRLIILVVLAVLLVPSLVGWGRAAVQCRVFGGGSISGREAAAPGSNLRPEEQTYLTLPEWYIVYSADEYAAYLGRPESRPSGFPASRTRCRAASASA